VCGSCSLSVGFAVNPHELSTFWWWWCTKRHPFRGQNTLREGKLWKSESGIGVKNTTPVQHGRKCVHACIALGSPFTVGMGVSTHELSSLWSRHGHRSAWDRGREGGLGGVRHCWQSQPPIRWGVSCPALRTFPTSFSLMSHNVNTHETITFPVDCGCGLAQALPPV